MNGARVAAQVLLKDLKLDLRTRDRLGHMGIFASLVVVLLGIALPLPTPETRSWLPVLLWVVLLFASLLGLARSFQAETEEGAVAGLALVPCDRGWVFLGKAGANLVALLGLELWTGVLFSVFLGLSWGPALPEALFAGLLGGIGLASVGTLLAMMTTSTRFREFLLPVLLFPLVLPVLVIASRATGEALAGRPVPGVWWGALALYDWVFILIPYLTFDALLED
ncbi:MAG: heme exporter protein CcmB [Myxococcota bacterium]